MTTTVRDILAEHFVMWHEVPEAGIRGEWRCACGKKFGFSDSAIDHQAEVLGMSTLTEVEREALLDAAWSESERGPRLLLLVERILAAHAAAPDALRAGIEALAAEWTEWSRGRSTERIDAFRDAALELRALLDDPAAAGRAT